MYLEHFKFREYPFVIGCDERFFYESAIHAEALANMLYVIQQRKGMVLVTGEVGAGKTFVGNILASRLGSSSQTVVLRNPPKSGKQLMRALARGIGMNIQDEGDKLVLAEELEQHLVRCYNRQRLVALVVDESQDFTADALEELRLLWNWEMNGQRLVQFLLIGQPEMRDRLQEPKWESLRQRIIISYHLGSLSPQDTFAYIAHRLRVASGGADNPAVTFASDALTEIFDATNGIPRLINTLCDNALLVAYGKDTHCVDRGIIQEVIRNMTCWGLRTSSEVSQRPVTASA